MDEATLLARRGLCGTEDALLEHSGPAERSLFRRLKFDPALRGLRLEQERLPRTAAMAALRGALFCAGTANSRSCAEP